MPTRLTEMRIADIVVGLRSRRDLGDLQPLAESIREVGLLHAPVVTRTAGLARGRRLLVAGRRRLAACAELGWTRVPVRDIDVDDLLGAEHDENAIRKDFLPSEAVAIGLLLEERETAAARKRRGTRTDLRGNHPEVDFGRVRDRIARRVGMGSQRFQRAREVVEAGPEFAHLVERMDRKGRVDGVWKELRALRDARRIAVEPPPLPSGPFRVIAIDPPWTYEHRQGDASHHAHAPYATMSVEQIKALPVPSLAHEDAVLWLWTTEAHRRAAEDVVAAWGFSLKATFYWNKMCLGLGDYARIQTEPLLFAIRGQPVLTPPTPPNVIEEMRRDHSRKPEAFYKLVEARCPGSKLEMFARTRREGWATWGDVASSDDRALHHRSAGRVASVARRKSA